MCYTIVMKLVRLETLKNALGTVGAESVYAELGKY